MTNKRAPARSRTRAPETYGADVAISAARTCARGLLHQDIPAREIANAMIVQALTTWVAGSNRKAAAVDVLAAWVAVRDAA